MESMFAVVVLTLLNIFWFTQLQKTKDLVNKNETTINALLEALSSQRYETGRIHTHTIESVFKHWAEINRFFTGDSVKIIKHTLERHNEGFEEVLDEKLKPWLDKTKRFEELARKLGYEYSDEVVGWKKIKK